MSTVGQSEQINELAGALAKAQGQMENAAKNKQNPHFKSRYADLAAVLDAIRAPLSANGLSTVQTMQITDRCILLQTTLLHASGQFISTEYPIAMGLKPQEMGSAITYGRRYSLAALVGIAQDDDDANAAANAAPSIKANGAKVTPEQAAEIAALCLQIHSEFHESFCDYFNIEAIPDLPAFEYERAMKAIAKKRSAV